MSILLSQSEFHESIRVNDYFIHKSYSLYKDRYYYFLVGEVFSCEITNLIDILIDDNKNEAKSVIGEFSLVVYDSVSNSVLFINDKSGRNLIFYSVKSGFSISDDFWSIVHHDKYLLSDIDVIELKTQLFFSASSTYKTILNGISIFENAILARYIDTSLSIEKYWQFRLVENDLTTEEKYDALDAGLKNAFKCIKDSNPSNVTYGIGVSGGMDSRIIPHYAKNFNMPLKSFIIGQEKPNKLWKSNDHSSSDLVVDYFNLEHTKLSFNELSYEEKNQLDCENVPLGSSQVFKIPNINKCDFDVLLTGASGFIVGSSPFYSKNRALNLLDIVFFQQSDLKLKVNNYKIKKGLNYLFGNIFNVQDELPYEIKGVISTDEIKKIKRNNEIFLSKMKDASDTEKLMNYALGVLGQKNKSGAFESILNQKKNYTPYTPFLLDVVATWNEEDIYDRKLFEGFIRERLPELASIKQQNHKAAINIRTPNFIRRLSSLFLYVVKGQGVMNYNNWVKQREFKNYIDIELNKHDYISSFVHLDTIQRLVDKRKINSDVLANCLKMNRLLFLIDNIEDEFNGLDRNK